MDYLPDQVISFLLTQTGGTDGNADANVDGSASSVDFLLTPGATGVPDRLAIESIVLTLRDAGAFNANAFGAMTALTTGLELVVDDDSGAVQVNFVGKESAAEQVIKDNATLISLGDVFLKDDATASGVLRVKMVMEEIIGAPLKLLTARGTSRAKRLRMTVNDNLTGVEFLRVIARGRKV